MHKKRPPTTATLPPTPTAGVMTWRRNRTCNLKNLLTEGIKPHQLVPLYSILPPRECPISALKEQRDLVLIPSTTTYIFIPPSYYLPPFLIITPNPTESTFFLTRPDTYLKRNSWWIFTSSYAQTHQTNNRKPAYHYLKATCIFKLVLYPINMFTIQPTTQHQQFPENNPYCLVCIAYFNSQPYKTST